MTTETENPEATSTVACVCCGSSNQVEETTLTDSAGKTRNVACCERCFMSGKIFHAELWRNSAREESEQ